MSYRKEGKIKYRIISLDNILEIASFFEELSKEDDGRTSFTVYFYDNSSVSCETDDVLKSTVFKRKDVKRIHFYYSSNKKFHEVKVLLTESHFLSEELNVYEIHGSDETWYNATLQKLEDILFGITKRSLWRQLWGFPLFLVNYVLFSLLADFIMLILLGFKHGRIDESITTFFLFEAKPTEDAVLFIPDSLFVLSYTLIFAIIVLFVHLLYPEMEFAFNPHRYICRKRWKTAIGWAFTTILVPIALSLLLNNML